MLCPCRHGRSPGRRPWFIFQEATAAAAEATVGAGAGTWPVTSVCHPCLSPEAVHFLCGEATLRKVKVSMGKTVDLGSHHSRALFSSCSSVCGRAVERCSGMEKHTHLVHLRCGGTGGLARVGSGLTTLFLAGDRQSQSRMKGRRTLLHGAGCWRGHAG